MLRQPRHGLPVLPLCSSFQQADYPLITDDEISVVPGATYAISKSASLQGFHWFQRLMSSDWRYQGLQYGTKTNYLPTSEKARSYEVQVAGLSFNWAF